MGGKKDAKVFLWVGLFTSIAIIGFIGLVFDLSRWFFLAELVILIFLGVIAAIGLAAIYNGLGFGLGFLAFMFGIMLLDLLIMYFRLRPIGLGYLSTIVSCSIGFVVSVVNLKGEAPKEMPEYNEPIHEPARPAEHAKADAPAPPVEIVEAEPPVKEVKKTVKKSFSPGKLVASKTSSYYHSPKCEWAKKIKKSNRIWFKSEDEAMEQGLKQHYCLN